VEQLGAGKRPAVHVNVNGYDFRSTVAVMGGAVPIGVSAGVRQASGLQGGTGSPSRSLSPTPAEVDVRRTSLQRGRRPRARSLRQDSNSLQRYHVDNIAGAKSPETRRGRIEKAVALFLDGKQR
jgi:hypothetical protein